MSGVFIYFLLQGYKKKLICDFYKNESSSLLNLGSSLWKVRFERQHLENIPSTSYKSDLSLTSHLKHVDFYFLEAFIKWLIYIDVYFIILREDGKINGVKDEKREMV